LNTNTLKIQPLLFAMLSNGATKTSIPIFVSMNLKAACFSYCPQKYSMKKGFMKKSMTGSESYLVIKIKGIVPMGQKIGISYFFTKRLSILDNR